MQKTERLMAIALLLHARGKMTAQRLAEILGVSVRTIYRDIDALSLAHVPVTMEYGPGGGYYLPHDYRFDPTFFTSEEAVSLVLSADMAGNYSLFADDDGLQRALMKLEAFLPEEYRSAVRAARERILFDTTQLYEQSTDATIYLENIRLAVLGATPLDILYPCDGISEWRRVEPCGLVFKGLLRRHARAGVWYMVAFCQTCQQYCTFRVSHIEDLRVCEEKMLPRIDFDLRTYWQEARRHLEEREQPLVLLLRVQATGRANLSGDYTVLQEEADHSVLVQVKLDSFKEAVTYSLALGTTVSVLTPDKVREAVVATARSIIEMYGTETS